MKGGLAITRDRLIAALDVGSAKVCCFVAEAGSDGSLRVVGIGHQASHGVRAGAVVDMEGAEASIRSAVHAAEQMAGGRTIEDVFVNCSCGAPVSRNVTAEVSVAGHEIGDGDLRRVLAQGSQNHENGERELIHSIPIHYSIDGSRGIRDPRGMYGGRLGVNMHVVTAAAGPVRSLKSCVARCHLELRDLVVSPYASGLSSLVEDEMDLGVTLIDMGAGTTSIAVFFDGEVAYTECLPIGGAHVTNDIARGLSTPVAQAERMKTLYGSAVPSPADEHEIIDVPQVGEEDPANPNHVPKSILVGIIQPRIEETFEMVRAHLEASGFAKLAGRRVVLTGGASQLQGVHELASLILDKQVRLGRPLRIGGLAEATGGPAFSTCAGLLIYAISRYRESSEKPLHMSRDPGGVLGRLGQWIREYL